MDAKLDGKTYTQIIDKEFSWSKWAYPTTEDGKLDHHRAKTEDDLKEFVDLKLFPYLKKFKKTAESPDTLEYKIGEIFGEIKNSIKSGYCIRDVINIIQAKCLSLTTLHQDSTHLLILC